MIEIVRNEETTESECSDNVVLLKDHREHRLQQATNDADVKPGNPLPSCDDGACVLQWKPQRPAA